MNIVKGPRMRNRSNFAGYDFNTGVDHHALLESFRRSGFQATNFGLAVEEIKKMVSVKKSCGIGITVISGGSFR